MNAIKMATDNVNRGVQAREIEIINSTNARLDMDTSTMSRQATDSSMTQALSDQTASYVQVIVQKHRRTRPPVASSPVVTRGGAGDDGGALPAAVVLACPALAAIQSACGGAAPAQASRGAGGGGQSTFENVTRNDTYKQDYSSSEEEADAVEVLRLERVGEVLASRAARGGLGACGGRVVRRARRRGARLLASLLGPPRLLLDLPIALLLHLERCVLEAVRALAVEGAAECAEALGKPALAAAHNALVAVLAVAAGVARGVREALRPLAAAALDAVEPLARLVGAARLVHVQFVHCRCGAPPAPARVL